MRAGKFALVSVGLALMNALTCHAGIFISTNGFAYFSPAQQTALQLTNALAADGGSDFIISVEPDGQVTNYYSSSFPVNPPAGLSNVIAISVNPNGAILALTSAGMVSGWGLSYGYPQNPPPPAAAQVPSGLSNVVAISAGDSYGLGLLSNGTVAIWPGSPTVPSNLTNVVAIDAGEGNLALKADGTVVSWGFSFSPPAGLSNVIAVSCWQEGCLALLGDGTLIGWDGTGVHTNLLPSGVANTVAISGAPDRFLALQSDGSVVIGGTPPLVSFAEPLANVFYLGRMVLGSAIVVEGDGEANFTVQPGNQTIGTGGTIYLHARAAGQSPMQYQWQCNGTNIPGATDDDLILTNATESDAGNYQAIVAFTFNLGPYWAGSRVAAVTVLPPPPRMPAFLNTPLFQANGDLIITANTPNGTSITLTNSSLFSIEASTDLVNWAALTNGWSVTNGGIELQGAIGAANSREFYRLISQ